MVKDPPAMWGTGVLSLGWENPLKEAMATHYSVPAWRIPMGCSLTASSVHGVAKNWTQLSDSALVYMKFKSFPSSTDTKESKRQAIAGNE